MRRSLRGLQYALVPKALLEDRALGASAKVMYAYLQTWANAQTDVVFPGQRLLAERLGVSVRQIQYLIEELEARGWLHRRRSAVEGHGRANAYELMDRCAPSGEQDEHKRTPKRAK